MVIVIALMALSTIPLVSISINSLALSFVNGYLEWDLKGFKDHCFNSYLDATTMRANITMTANIIGIVTASLSMNAIITMAYTSMENPITRLNITTGRISTMADISMACMDLQT